MNLANRTSQCVLDRVRARILYHVMPIDNKDPRIRETNHTMGRVGMDGGFCHVIEDGRGDRISVATEAERSESAL